MATTGFWPVKGRLKAIIEYADNPNKTTDPKYLDRDLAAVVRYAENDAKTDRKMYVDSINCPVKTACEQMMATKQRFGKLSGNIAYHGYQSFAVGEVTPELAHEIGMETARRMWGAKYEIVVTTHLNTDNIHNHIVVNSVSFRTGWKFENHISDHIRLREISDAVCKERGLSVLEDARFYARGQKKEYWVHQNGGMTHRDILRRDIDEAIRHTLDWKTFDQYLKDLGYTYARRPDFKKISLIAPGWQRPVRIDSLGEDYTQERIRERLMESREVLASYFAVTFPKRRTPLLTFEENYRQLKKLNGVQLIFEIFIDLIKLVVGTQEPEQGRPLSPAVRQEARNIKEIVHEHHFLQEHGLDEEEQLTDFIRETEREIASLEAERQKEYNCCRRPKSPEDKAAHKARAREISAKIKPLRKELATAEKAFIRYPEMLKLLDTERQLEQKIKIRNRERSDSR